MVTVAGWINKWPSVATAAAVAEIETSGDMPTTGQEAQQCGQKQTRFAQYFPPLSGLSVPPFLPASTVEPRGSSIGLPSSLTINRKQTLESAQNMTRISLSEWAFSIRSSRFVTTSASLPLSAHNHRVATIASSFHAVVEKQCFPSA